MFSIILLLSVLGLALNAQRINTGVVNEIKSRPVNLYWVSPTGKEVLQMEKIVPMIPWWFGSSVGHSFISRDADTGEVISNHVVTKEGFFTIRDESLPRCKIDGDEQDYKNCFEQKDETKMSEKQLKERRDQDESDRLDHSLNQPKVVPKFTAMGFEKRKVPAKLWTAVQKFYKDNLPEMSRERWGETMSVVNFWESPTYMVHLPVEGNIMSLIYEEVGNVLKEWSGVDDIEPTACYGMRVYLNNSILENHVDRLKTHAISAIINVDQDVDEPWELEIYDHDGNKHLVVMEPGDMVLYESASAVHGRPTPLKGHYYANFFTHFKPKQHELWPFTSDNWRMANKI